MDRPPSTPTRTVYTCFWDRPPSTPTENDSFPVVQSYTVYINFLVYAVFFMLKKGIFTTLVNKNGGIIIKFD